MCVALSLRPKRVTESVREDSHSRVGTVVHVVSVDFLKLQVEEAQVHPIMSGDFPRAF